MAGGMTEVVKQLPSKHKGPEFNQKKLEKKDLQMYSVIQFRLSQKK
jgi:hypothetical protein